MTRRRFWSSWVGWRRSTSGSRAALSRFAQRASGVGTSTARRVWRQCRACCIAALTAIAELAGVKVSEVRAMLKSAGAQTVASADALGAPSAAADAPQSAQEGAANAAGEAADDAARAVSVGGSAWCEGVRGEGAAAALWVDPAVHADECRASIHTL
jgi:hypothetical protein